MIDIKVLLKMIMVGSEGVTSLKAGIEIVLSDFFSILVFPFLLSYTYDSHSIPAAYILLGSGSAYALPYLTLLVRFN